MKNTNLTDSDKVLENRLESLFGFGIFKGLTQAGKTCSK